MSFGNKAVWLVWVGGVALLGSGCETVFELENAVNSKVKHRVLRWNVTWVRVPTMMAHFV